MRTITVNIARDNARGPALYKLDYGTKVQFVGMELPDTYEVHFARNLTDNALRMIGDSTGVEIPDALVQSPGLLYMWLYVHTETDDGWTKRTVTLPITERAGISEAEPTPVQQDVITQAIAALNAGVDRAEDAADAADQSAQDAEDYAGAASASATAAATSATNASASATAAAGSASTATTKAGEAAQSATSAAQSAQTASEAVQELVDITASADTLPAGSQATATYADGHLTIGVPTGATGAKGDKGDTGAKGDPGEGVPTGGTTGQMLVKASDADYDTGWVDQPVTQEEFAALKQYVLDMSPVAEATGAIASVDDAAPLDAEDVTVQIEPVQEGSGDPSPDNVRPITGLTGATVTRCGKNLFDQDTFFGTHGGVRQEDGSWYYNILSTIAPGSAIWENVSGYDGQISLSLIRKTLNASGSQGARFRWKYVDGTTSTIYIDNSTEYVQFSNVSTAGKVVEEVEWDFGSSNNSTWIKDMSIIFGSTATAYEPYHGETYSITFPSEAGTVYGGTFDVTTGKLVVDMAMVDLGTLNYVLNNHAALGQYFWTNVSGLRVRRAGDYPSTIYPSICSAYKCVSRTVSVFVDGTYCFDGDAVNVTQVQFKDDAYSDAASFKAAMQGVQFVYQLATPITYDLTPQQIALLRGANSIWADTGDTTLTYRQDVALLLSKLS